MDPKVLWSSRWVERRLERCQGGSQGVQGGLHLHQDGPEGLVILHCVILLAHWHDGACQQQLPVYVSSAVALKHMHRRLRHRTPNMAPSHLSYLQG
eukprot:1185342-Prorocentrum_minimum.AAC.2